MGSRSYGYGARPASGVLCALVVLLTAAPPRAEAGCSHYVVARTDPSTASSRSLALLDRAEAPAERPTPCHGPSCSGRPSRPAPIPVAPTPLRLDRWVCLAETGDFPHALNHPFLAPADAVSAGRVDDRRLDRPPRPESA